MRFNRGLSLIHMVRLLSLSFLQPSLADAWLSQGRLDEGMLDLAAAREDKQTGEHDVIDEAVADQAVVRPLPPYRFVPCLFMR